MNKTFILLILIIAGASIKINAQKVGVKTNLLYGAYTYTPNLGLEIGLSPKTTLSLGGGYNPWNLDGTESDNKKLVHWLGQVEARYWLCQRFTGHFFGIHATGAQYNISGHKLPLLFGKDSKDFRYEGYAYGGGISYGYQFILGKRWNLEATLGAGYLRLNYDKHHCQKCGEKVESAKKNYFGPTSAGISLIYIIK